MSIPSSEYFLQLSLYILVCSRLVVHTKTSGLSQKYTSDHPKHLGPFTESHFPVKPFYYPFSDIIKIGMKFRNIKCTLPVIYRFIKNNNNYTIFSYFNFLMLSESASFVQKSCSIIRMN